MFRLGKKNDVWRSDGVIRMEITAKIVNVAEIIEEKVNRYQNGSFFLSSEIKCLTLAPL